MELTERVRSVVSDFLAQRGRAAAVSDEAPLFSSGLLDSIDVLHLIIILEREFGIVISALDVSLDALDTIARIARLVDLSARG